MDGGRATWGPPAATVGPRARLRQLWVPVAERAIRGSRRIISACGGRRDLCLLRDRDCAELAVNALFFIFAPPSDASAAERSPAHSPVASEAPPEAATLKLLRRYRAPLGAPSIAAACCELDFLRSAGLWWLSVGVLRNASRHADTLSVCVIEFNRWAQAHLDTIRTPSVH